MTEKARFMKGLFRWDGSAWACLRPIQWAHPIIETRRPVGSFVMKWQVRP